MPGERDWNAITEELIKVSERAPAGWAERVRQAIEAEHLMASQYVGYGDNRDCGCFYGHVAELQYGRAVRLAEGVLATLEGLDEEEETEGNTPIELLLMENIFSLHLGNPEITRLYQMLEPYCQKESEHAGNQ